MPKTGSNRVWARCLTAALLFLSSGARAEAPEVDHRLRDRPTPSGPETVDGRRERVRPPLPPADDLPTIVYVTNVSGDSVIAGMHDSYIRDRLEACRYPNLAKVRDPETPAELEKQLTNGKLVPQDRDNYLVLFNAHGWFDEKKDGGKSYLVGDGTKVTWSGDETVAKILTSLRDEGKKKLNIWLETCHSGTCSVSCKTSGIGCATQSELVAMAYGGTLDLITAVACDAASGRCSYFHDSRGRPTYDNDGDGVLTAEELQRLAKDYFKNPVTTERRCSADIAIPKTGAIPANTYQKAQNQVSQCTESYASWCAKGGGRIRSGETTLAMRSYFSLRGSARIEMSGDSFPVRFTDVTTVQEASFKSVEELTQWLDQAKADPGKWLAKVGSREQMDRAILRDWLSRHIRDSGRDDRAASAEARHRLRSARVDAFELTAVAFDSYSLGMERPLACSFESGVIPTGTHAAGVQIPEFRNFRLNFPRCATTRGRSG